MSQETFPVKNALTRNEFDHLWELYDRQRDLDPSRVEEHLAGSFFTEYESVSQNFLGTCDDAKTAKIILIDVFSNTAETHRSEYAIAHASASPETFQALASDFFEHSLGKHRRRTRSPLMPVLAKLMMGQMLTNPLVVTAENSYLLIPGIFTRPDRIETLNGSERFFSKSDEETAQDRLVLRHLTQVAFGIDVNNAPRPARDQNPAHANISAQALCQTVEIVGTFREPYRDSDMAREFVHAAAVHRPDLFSRQSVQASIRSAAGKLEAIHQVIAPARAALGNWLAMTQT